MEIEYRAEVIGSMLRPDYLKARSEAKLRLVAEIAHRVWP